MDTEDVEKIARTSAIRLLARREYSVFELQTKLKQKELPASAIDKTIKYLSANNYQSDLRCAIMILRHGIHSFWGPNKIRMSMEHKGIARDLINSTFDNQSHYNDLVLDQELDYYHYWGELAKMLALRKFSISFTIKNNFINEVKLKKFLYNRGFESEHISYVIKYFLDLKS